MANQNYKNHARVVPLFHVVTSVALIAAIIGSFVNLSDSWNNHNNLYSASLICLTTLIMASYFVYIRQFPLTVQDRVIRAEENLRHYILTGKQLDNRLSRSQLIALRFASDDEFPTLADRAVKENMKASAIKQAVKQWREDQWRA